VSTFNNVTTLISNDTSGNQAPANEATPPTPPKADDDLLHTCNYTLKRKGCYNDRQIVPRPFPVMVMKDENMSVGDITDKEAYAKFLPAFICRCAEEVRKRKWWSFGIQNHVECHSGPDEGRFDEDGAAAPALCVNSKLDTCGEGDKTCAGKDGANFVYTVITDSHQEIKKIIYARKKRSSKSHHHHQRNKH